MNRRFLLLTAVRLVTALAVALPFQLALARGPLVLFEQPVLDDVREHAYVVAKPRRGNFYVVLWQKNPHRIDGALVPVTWAVGDKTGFYPTDPLQRRQMGMRNNYGSTALQIEGNVVGAYLNSADLIRGSNLYKHMITPAYDFPPLARIALFDESDSAVSCTLELQVPVAADGGGSPRSGAYINLNLLMAKGAGEGQVTVNGGLFYNRRADDPERVGFDPVTKHVIVLTPIQRQSQWSTYTEDSEVRQGTPWKGWKKFRFTVTRDNFVSALKAVSAKHPTVSPGDPAEWKLAMIHLNAEIRYETAPAEMGWSMRGLKCGVGPVSGISKDAPASASRPLNRVLREVLDAIPK
jgi:hypothetical protein